MKRVAVLAFKWQKRYYRCVKKFGRGYMQGEARQEDRDDCLERFDDFQKCVLVRPYATLFAAVRQHAPRRGGEIALRRP